MSISIKHKLFRSIPPDVFLGKSVLKTCYNFTGKTPLPKCDFNKVACNFIEITLRDGCSPVNLLHIFRTPFPENIFGGLLLAISLSFF